MERSGGEGLWVIVEAWIPFEAGDVVVDVTSKMMLVGG
jgi:hypothetical protein